MHLIRRPSLDTTILKSNKRNFSNGKKREMTLTRLSRLFDNVYLEKPNAIKNDYFRIIIIENVLSIRIFISRTAANARTQVIKKKYNFLKPIHSLFY